MLGSKSGDERPQLLLLEGTDNFGEFAEIELNAPGCGLLQRGGEFDEDRDRSIGCHGIDDRELAEDLGRAEPPCGRLSGWST